MFVLRVIKGLLFIVERKRKKSFIGMHARNKLFESLKLAQNYSVSFEARGQNHTSLNLSLL